MNEPRPANHPDFSDADRKAWATAAADQADRVIGDQAGVHGATIRSWRRKFDIRKVSGRTSGRHDVASTNDKRDFASTCRTALPEVFRTLMDLLRNGENRERLAAAKELLDRALGKPFQSSAVEVSGELPMAEALYAALAAEDEEDEG